MAETQALAHRPRAPGIVYTALAGAMLLFVGLFAISQRQTPPPTIAEFAPQAVEQIKNPLPQQSSEFGEGFGQGGGATGFPPPEAAAQQPPPIDVPRVRKCVGDPPRQTEDPQSPPCIAYWEGDNGGSTYQGVTRDEIRIVVPANYGGRRGDLILAHFNSRYQFYGRKIVRVTCDFTGGDRPQHMIANAIKADEECKAFASTMYGDATGREFIYYDELARRGILSMNAHALMVGEEHFREHHPYQWSYLPGFDIMSKAKAEWICKALKGKPADFAGGSERVKDRKFGLIYTVDRDGSQPNLRPMEEILEGCGVDIALKRSMLKRSGLEGDQAGFEEAQVRLVEMQTEGVTSIICECHTQTSGLYLGSSASKQGYFPEWLLGTYMIQDEDVHVRFWEGGQVDHSFGLTWWNKQTIPQDSPWFWAIREQDPNHQFENVFAYYDPRWFYDTVRMLAAGIQMAGPHLTPETFARGLMTTKFPNPRAGQPPYWQGEVGFGPNDHTALNDAALFWHSKSERSSWDGVSGAMCYASQGIRYKPGSFPSSYAGLFERPCY